MENKKITAIKVKWTYDEIYSSAAFFESDINSDKTLDIEENLKLLDRSYEELKKNNFFTSLKLNNQKLNNQKINNFNAYFNNEILVYDFIIDLTEPIDSFKNIFTASFYDKSYFIELYFQEKNPIKFSGDNANQCKYEIYEDMTETFYYGMVNPETIRVICR